MSPLETMRSLLEEQLATIQRKPEIFHPFADGLRGAATFAREVGVRHGDQILIAKSDEVMA